MCCQILGSDGKRSESYIYEGDQVERGITVELKSIPFHDYICCAENININSISSMLAMTSPGVKILGHSYKPGSVLVAEYNLEPALIQIEEIYIVNHAKYFLCKRLNIMSFDSHFNAFHVQPTANKQMLSSTYFRFNWPQQIYFRNRQMYVMLKNVPDIWCL